MDVSFQRDEEIRRESRQLPAGLYKIVKILLSRNSPDNLFVPIRAMQYLAVVDHEEIIFVDGQGPRKIEIAWQHFRPQDRADLRDPVGYECVYYDKKGEITMRRLQGEFFKALELIERRQPRPGRGSVTSLAKRGR